MVQIPPPQHNKNSFELSQFKRVFVYVVFIIVAFIGLLSLLQALLFQAGTFHGFSGKGGNRRHPCSRNHWMARSIRSSVQPMSRHRQERQRKSLASRLMILR